MIELQNFTKEDFSRLINWISSEEELVQFAGAIFRFPLTENQLEEYILEPAREVFRVYHKDSGSIIGHCEINSLTDESPNLCRILIGDKTYRGKGIGREIVDELLIRCFRNKRAAKVELNVFDWNLNAIRCYEKAGFRIDPERFHEVKLKMSVWRSVKMYITRKDYLSCG